MRISETKPNWLPSLKSIGPSNTACSGLRPAAFICVLGALILVHSGCTTRTVQKYQVEIGLQPDNRISMTETQTALNREGRPFDDIAIQRIKQEIAADAEDPGLSHEFTSDGRWVSRKKTAYESIEQFQQKEADLVSAENYWLPVELKLEQLSGDWFGLRVPQWRLTLMAAIDQVIPEKDRTNMLGDETGIRTITGDVEVTLTVPGELIETHEFQFNNMTIRGMAKTKQTAVWIVPGQQMLRAALMDSASFSVDFSSKAALQPGQSKPLILKPAPAAKPPPEKAAPKPETQKKEAARDAELISKEPYRVLRNKSDQAPILQFDARATHQAELNRQPLFTGANRVDALKFIYPANQNKDFVWAFLHQPRESSSDTSTMFEGWNMISKEGPIENLFTTKFWKFQGNEPHGVIEFQVVPREKLSAGKEYLLSFIFAHDKPVQFKYRAALVSLPRDAEGNISIKDMAAALDIDLKNP